MNFDLLKRLCETPGIPSHEGPIRAVVVEELRSLTDTVTADTMGNVIGIKRGSSGPKVMIAAHMDEIGFMVKHVDDKGFLRLQPVGGWDARNMVAQRVYVHGFAVDVSTSFKLFSWLLDSSSAGNMTVAAPSAATTGATGSITLTFSGLAPATKYLGSVFYSGSSGLPNPTIVRVDTP